MASDERRLGVLTGLKAEARLAAALGLVVAGGGTREGARRAELPGCTALLSFGLAGGLDPDLAPGALIVPEAVIVGGRTIACDRGLVAWLGGATVRAVVDAPDAVCTIAAKRLLFQATGAAAVDLESGAVATRGLRFAVLRAVCDPADETLPPAALAGLTAAGRIDLLGVTTSLLREPGQLGALLRLARHAAAARRALRQAVRALAGS